jgi:predicted MPP superfamily phosphohydrolase
MALPAATRTSRRRFLSLGLGSAAALAVGYTVGVERYLFQLNRYEIPLARLPTAFDGFTIAQITDLHYGFLMPLTVVRHVLSMVGGLGVDAIVGTGDYVHERNSTRQIDTVWPELARLRAPFGVWSVLGNHDHWADTARSLEWLAETGQGVRHRSVAIEKGGARIWIGGSGDFYEDALGIDEAFRETPPDECKVLLSHNPDAVDTPYRAEIDLVMSGHTHGGQVVMPFLGAPVLPVRNKRYSSGLVAAPRTRVFISRGIGWALLPVRFNCPPEIAVLQLRCESSG